ncbi:MAG: methionyl-tRNA formyltransferase [Pyrinomonadaceae bacterium]
MKIVFMGTPNAAVPSLERLIADGHQVVAVYTQPDRPAGRGNKIVYSPVKLKAIERSIPVFQPLKIKAADTIEEFRSHGAKVVVVVAYGRILPETYLNAFEHGAVNVHFSLLPKYRGAAPVNWAIVNGETETGVTTMQMDVGLDTGPILLQAKTEIGANEGSIELMARLSAIGADLLSETLACVDELESTEQNDDLASYAPIMRREDGLIDWTRPAKDISDQIRGFQPFPGSFSYLGSGKLTFWRASIRPSEMAKRPGEVVSARNAQLVIACGGNTALNVDEIQPEGKRRMPVRDFLNGAKLKTGDVLGL